jgi:hypothetical protein
MNGNRGVRSLSYTEITAALTCQARWDFAYGDRLAGSALRRRAIATTLSDGRAWGAAVAAWHAYQPHDDLFSGYDAAMARQTAHSALQAAYLSDIQDQQMSGIYVDPGVEVERVYRLHEMLEHYMATADKMPNLTLLEGRFETQIPSRGGKHRSSKYRLEGYIDGATELGDGGQWIVEFKLRASLTSRQQLDIQRQHLWYAWARQQETSRPVVGVIVDERFNEVPKPAKQVIAKRTKGGVTYRPSGDADELTTEGSYLELCDVLGVVPRNHETKLQALRARRWQQRVELLFRPGQLAEAGLELVSAGHLIADLERGDRYPIRNGQRHICGACRYRDICANPQDHLFVESLFERVPAKRNRRDDPSPVNPAHFEPPRPDDPIQKEAVH